ncbi:MAG: glutamine-hydrolyzing carbamoyl-phosphate synthase small subunit [Planctomycetota bacterium]|jgi:carbamoyl-phosphate synthase small subunit|nr:glutamine-hydrolyzing carbamoyl-phosphate synthase small subunit [Planctomycetota bacterium]
MSPSAFIALADGTVFYGKPVGAAVDTLGEVVFNTGMTGYQEIISDPSYAGQIVALTTAEVGNYGCNPDDMESRQLFLRGLLVQHLNPPSNFRAAQALDEMLRAQQIPALSGIDTRKLTLLLRSAGTMKAFIHCSDANISVADAVARAREWEGLDGQDYASRVSVAAPYQWNETGDLKIVAYDFGVKFNILRELSAAGMQVTVVPAGTTADAVLALKPDGVFLSNGPADPSAVTGAIDAAKKLSGKTPLMGICLGHQIIGLAHGCQCRRLKFGHHGCNHPVKNEQTGQVEITSQNHNYEIHALPGTLEQTHVNLNDRTVEGLRHKTEPVFSVQYHPEAAPGPHDARYLFRQFRELITNA